MDGVPDAETQFISSLTCNRGKVAMWLDRWAAMESWVMAVDRVRTQAGSWSYIQSQLVIMKIKRRHTILGGCYTRCMLNSVYAVFGVCSTWGMLYSVYDVLGVCWTRCMLVLATGPGNPPAVQFLAGGSVRFGSKPGQKPKLLCLGGVVPQTGHKPAGFGRVVPGLRFHFYGSCNFCSN